MKYKNCNSKFWILHCEFFRMRAGLISPGVQGGGGGGASLQDDQLSSLAVPGWEKENYAPVIHYISVTNFDGCYCLQRIVI